MSRATSRSRWAAVRDLAVISLAVLALLWLGTTTEAFDRLRRWIGDRWEGHTGDVLIGFALVTAGALAFALLRWRADARERRARSEAEARFQRLVEQMPSVTYTWHPSANDPPSWDVSPRSEEHTA